MGINPSTEGFVPGLVVIIRRGRWRGEWFAVWGCQAGRVLVADGKHRSARSPKPKNPLHLQPTEHVIEEAAQAVREGRRLDDGYLWGRIVAVRTQIGEDDTLERKEVDGAAWPKMM
jgi:hypothetical protein